MHTRLARPEDLPFVVDIDELCRSPQHWGFSNFVAYIGCPRTHLVVVEEGECNTIGFYMGQFTSDGEALVVPRLLVHPDFRRSGAGTALLSHALKLAERRGASSVTAIAHERDDEGILFFRSFGGACRLHTEAFSDGDGYGFTLPSSLRLTSD